MPSVDTIDFRLIEVELELSDLHYYLDLLEKQIKERQADYESDLQKIIKEKGLTPDDSDWQMVIDYENLKDYRMPRFFRAPFLISLYAVYESAVTEIAKLIKDKKDIAISINDLRGDFLDRAKKYFKDVLHFQLCQDKKAWQGINVLSVIRNAFAHANGRIEMFNQSLKQKILNLEKQKVGISSESGFIIIEERFSRDTLSSVSASLNDLVKRYKAWDDTQISP